MAGRPKGKEQPMVSVRTRLPLKTYEKIMRRLRIYNRYHMPKTLAAYLRERIVYDTERKHAKHKDEE